jgi:hypothetical protein
MSRLDVVEHALSALSICLYTHGPACVCTSCTAYGQATALLPRLAQVLAILEAWSREEDEEPLLPLDISMLLRLLEEDSTVRPAAPHET